MSSITFEAIIDSVHFDPKKGVVKIALIADSRVSLDKLTTLGPRDENVIVSLASMQTEIESFSPSSLSLGEEEAENLKHQWRDYQRKKTMKKKNGPLYAPGSLSSEDEAAGRKDEAN